MITIDASVVNKLVLGEEGNDKVKIIIQDYITGKEKIIVPDFLFYEVANTLATKTFFSFQRVTRSLTKIYKVGLNVHHCTEAEVKEAARLAKKFKTSVYDMLYAVVAKYHKASLITADEKFVRQTKFKFVKLLNDHS